MFIVFQIPIEDTSVQENHSRQSSSSAVFENNRRQERTDLEETFNLDDDHEEVRLLPSSPVEQFRPHFNNDAIVHIQPHQSTDGVFSNMSAKPESNTKTEDIPPVSTSISANVTYKLTDDFLCQSYEEASADATPPYWQTTIFAPPGMGDMVLVEGLPVGNIFTFLWNFMGKTNCNYYPCLTYLFIFSFGEFSISWIYVDLPTTYNTCSQSK